MGRIFNASLGQTWYFPHDESLRTPEISPAILNSDAEL